MNKRYVLVLVAVLALVAGGIFYFWYKQQPQQENLGNNVRTVPKLNSMTCDELSMLLNEEHSKQDFSCRSDQECFQSDVFTCNCMGINTNTQKAKEINKILREKECLRVQIECMPFECKCINKVCTKVKVGW